MAPPPPSLCYRELRVASLGTLFFLTPLDAAGDVAGPALSVELAHGVAGLAAFEAPAGLGRRPRPRGPCSAARGSSRGWPWRW